MSDDDVDRDSARLPRADVFLSYSARDRESVGRIAQRLRAGGVEPWFDRWSLTGGERWQPNVECALADCRACAVFVGEGDLGGWERHEVDVAIARAVAEPDFRVFPVLLAGVGEPFDYNRLPAFLATRTWVDFRRGVEDDRALQDLLNAVGGIPFGPDDEVVRDGAEVVPYMGLEAFGEGDADLFFGRDREIQRLVEKVRGGGRFVAVLGASGSGKSSLVRAGLVHALRAADEDWLVVLVRPGAAPLRALAAQLATLGAGRAMGATLDDLTEDPRTLGLAVELAIADSSSGDRALIVIDQLEELFTLCRDQAERAQFVALLTSAVLTPGARTVLVVTLRADFYARLAGHPELAQLVSAQPLLLGPLDSGGLLQAIELPARCVGYSLEPGLAETIRSDVGAEPGSLPLLEHALLELWRRRRGRLLTLEGYRDAGGVDGALAQRAEAVYGAFGAERQKLARRMLLRLTEPGEGTEDTRRRAGRDELVPVGSVAADEVLRALVDARLLTSDRDEAGADVVDVAHEALIRGWPRLRAWIEADRAGLLTHRRLTDAARDWERLGGESGALYRGARLVAAGDWAHAHADEVSSLERHFLETSEAAQRDELTRARQRARRLRALAGGLGALAVVVALLAVLALRQRDDARRRTREATSLALNGAAIPLLASRPDIALELGYEAYRSSPRPETTSTLLAALTAMRERRLVGSVSGPDAFNGVALSPNGRTLAGAGADGIVRLWDARTRRALDTPLRSHANGVTGVAFSPDGRTLASAERLPAPSTRGQVRLWDARTHHALGAPLRGHTSVVFGVAFSPDGRTLATAGQDRTVRLWNVRTHRARGTPLRGNRGGVRGVVFSPSGRALASAGEDGTIRLWDVRTHRALGAPLHGHAGPVYAVAFSPDGHTLATANTNGTARLWDVRTHRALGAPLHGHAGAVYAVAFSPDGHSLASAGADATVRLWNVRTHRALGAPLRGHTGPVVGVAFSRDGHTLASTGADGVVRLWDARPDRVLGAPLRGHSGTLSGVAFSPDGRTLATANANGMARLWDVRTRRAVGQPLHGHTGAGYAVAFSPDGRTLATADDDRTVRLWDVRTHRALGAPLRGHAGPVSGVAFSPDGATLASASADATVRLWNIRKPRALGTPLHGHAGTVYTVAFSPDGRRLASVGDDGTLRLWDVRTHRALGAPLHGHAGPVVGVAFSPDGRRLASGGDDGTVRLWDVRARRALGAPLHGHAGTVYTVAFSPDGRTLASASDDGTVRLWDVRTHRALGTPLHGHTGTVYGVAFSPDGRTLASAGQDGTLRLWQGLLWQSPAELRRLVCRARPGLTHAEWIQYVGAIPYHNSCA